jgi:hypothetical protein
VVAPVYVQFTRQHGQRLNSGEEELIERVWPNTGICVPKRIERNYFDRAFVCRAETHMEKVTSSIGP